MNCIVIDDEPDAIKAVKRHIDKTPGLFLRYSTTDPIEALLYLKDNNEVDFIFLDINMEGMKGLDFAKIVPHKVVITTAHEQHALASYDYSNIVDYLMKPIEHDKFIRAVSKVQSMQATEIGNVGNITEVKTPQGLFTINYDTTEFIKADRAVSIINGIETIPISLGELLELLPGKQFKRVHKSYIINLTKIVDLLHNKAKLRSGKTVPVGRAYR